MANTPDVDMRYLSVRNPARLAVVLNGFGGAAILLAILFFGGSFYVENEIGRAFCLGAFFSGLLGGIVGFVLGSATRSDPRASLGTAPTSPPPPAADSFPDVVAALRAGAKIQAIKHYRIATGVGLKEAKDAVEALARRL